MRKFLTLTLLAALACTGLASATGYHNFRANFVVQPVVASYTAPLAIATCGHAYSAQLVAPVYAQPIQVPVIAPIVGAITQQYTAPAVAQVVTQQYTAPAVVQTVVTPSYSSLAVVGNAYSHSAQLRVLQVRQRLAVVDHGHALNVRVANVKQVRQAVVVEQVKQVRRVGLFGRESVTTTSVRRAR
jgi:hypothetical protein